MRERLDPFLLARVVLGLTPAYAVKTMYTAPESTGVRNHPRVCGKDLARWNFKSPSAESPPRMRERRINRYDTGASAGITPAYAGKTSYLRNHSLALQNHPRVCGKDTSG